MSYHQSGEQRPRRPYPYRQGYAQQQHPPIHYGYQQQHPQIPQFQQQQWQPRRFRREQYWLQEQGYPQYQQHYQPYPQQQHHQTEYPQQYGPPQYQQQHDQYQQYQQHHQPEQSQQQHGFQQYPQQYDQHQQHQQPQLVQPQQQGPPRYPQQQGQRQQPRLQQHWRQKRFEKDVRSLPHERKPGKAATEKMDTAKIDAEIIRKNKETKADGSKIPLKVLKQALGHVISVETVNGYIVKGKLTDIQVINMNCELSQWLDENNKVCHVTSTRPSRKAVKMYDVLFVRGSMVRYWILPDVLINYTTMLITEFVKQRQEIIDLMAAKMGKTPGLKRPQEENPFLEPLDPIQIDLDEDENADVSDWFVIGKKDPKEDPQSPKRSQTEGQRSRKSSPSNTAPISKESPTKESHPSREEMQTTQPGGSTQVAKLVTPQQPITVRTTAPVEKPSYYYYDYHPTVPIKRQSLEAPSDIQGQKSRKSYSSEGNDWDPISNEQQGHPSITQPQPGGSSQVPSVRPQSTEYGPQYGIEVRSSAPGPGFHSYYTYKAPVPVNQQSTEALSRQGSEQIPTVAAGQIQHPMQYQVPGLGMTPPRPVYTAMQPPYPLLPGPVEGQLLYPPRRQLVPRYPQYSPQVQHPPQIQQPYPMLTYPAVVPQFIPSYPGPVLVEPSALPPPPEVIQQTVVNVRGKEILATEIGGCTYFDEPPPKP